MKLYYIIFFVFILFYLNSCTEEIESKKIDKIYNLESTLLRLKLVKKEDLPTIIKEKQMGFKVGIIKKKLIAILQEFTKVDEDKIQNDLIFTYVIDPENQRKLKIHIFPIANSKTFKGSLDIYLEIENEKRPIEENQYNQGETSIEKVKNLAQFSYTPPSEDFMIPFEDKEWSSKVKNTLIKGLTQDSFFKGVIGDFKEYFNIDIKLDENRYQPYNNFSISHQVGKHTLEVRIRANSKGEKKGFIGESTFRFNFEILPLKGRDLSKEIFTGLIDLSNAFIKEDNILWDLKMIIIHYLNRGNRWGIIPDYRYHYPMSSLATMLDIKIRSEDGRSIEYGNFSKGIYTFDVSLSSSLEGKNNGFGGEKTFKIKINIDKNKSLYGFNVLGFYTQKINGMIF